MRRKILDLITYPFARWGIVPVRRRYRWGDWPGGDYDEYELVIPLPYEAEISLVWRRYLKSPKE